MKNDKKAMEEKPVDAAWAAAVKDCLKHDPEVVISPKKKQAK